jgi:hypothetical protein
MYIVLTEIPGDDSSVIIGVFRTLSDCADATRRMEKFYATKGIQEHLKAAIDQLRYDLPELGHDRGASFTVSDLDMRMHELRQLAPKSQPFAFAVCELGQSNTYRKILGALNPGDYDLDRALLTGDNKALRRKACT